MSTPIKKCSCRQGRERLCVFHALLHAVVKLLQPEAFRPEAYRFGAGRRTPPVQQISSLTRRYRAGTDWHSGAVEKWAQHSFRVAGAQFLARSGINVGVIQLIGRWGSSATFRFVQTAASVPEGGQRELRRLRWAIVQRRGNP